MINYDNLWVIMQTDNMMKVELRKASNMSSSTFTKLSRNEKVSLDVLMCLCEPLNC
jgi:DNA-binding Xre family transcriptional regulator